MVQETRAMPPLGLERELLEQNQSEAAERDQTDLERSLAQLGPRTSVHGSGVMPGIPTPSDPVGAGPFAKWMAEWMAVHVPQVERKAAEYGSGSLARKGQRFAAAQSRPVEWDESLELGAAQYVLEKADRIEDAILRRQTPSDDTWTDIAIYALMVLFVRTHGHWF